ncbi:glycerophosphoryl diester phosphodiesterase [Sanguibacter keddieii DSM 10542]|uniref:Glycerophosphoryl diester phosphodiesterase n=1 Tax=Sanguibacter keddieii (strain ATCC 51767 / DSM 10542 / NCFB 3025 / ST-74) TaxID=446469 RepID=D1BI76_SANKS|nr:glycerophosphoryl diester phosphodiesterase [Sanguibacter keddieii DSM 10542]
MAREIAHGCTKSGDEILATIQGLRGEEQFTTIRHRGDFDANIPENSLTAFEESYLRCRPGIETDLRRTADNTLVMFHDTHVGKMLEPSYDPLTGQGPNAALSSLTWDQLQQKTLVNITREPQAGEKVPSLDQFLDHYRRVGGQSLLYVEIKNSTNEKAAAQAEIMDAVEQVAAFHRAHPEVGIFDRVVFKFRMSAFPLFPEWAERTRAIPDLPRVPLTQVQVSRQIARDLASDTTIPGHDGPAGLRMEAAVHSWSTHSATTDGVLSVEVTMKDSTGYTETDMRGLSDQLPFPFRGVTYHSPHDDSSAQPGTMASAVDVVHFFDKPLGQFVPVPDWVMFRAPGSFSWDDVLPNVDAGHSRTPVTPMEAFFNNSSQCCYSLRDRVDDHAQLDDDPEQNDQRILLPWLEDIKATVLTADDTDSIDAYFTTRGKKLDAGDHSVSPNRPDPTMNSLIYPGSTRFPSLMKFVTVELAPRGDPRSWFVQGSAVVSEDRPTSQQKAARVVSHDGPAGLMAVYGQATLTVDIAWSWYDSPDVRNDETRTTWVIPEHLSDGRHSFPAQVGTTTVDVHVTLSRRWASATDASIEVVRTDRSSLWGMVCGGSLHTPTDVSRCNWFDQAGSKLLDLPSYRPTEVRPGDVIGISSSHGARPLTVSTALWGRGWNDVPVSMSSSRIDAAGRWDTPLSVPAPGDHGLVDVRYVLRADSYRTPL